MPGSPVAIGLSVEAAKDRLAALAADCPTVDAVVNGGGRRERPDGDNTVWLYGTRNLTTQSTRGGLDTETFDLQFLIETSTKLARIDAGPDREARQRAADDRDERETRARRWTIANEIAERLETRGSLETSSATLVVSDETAAFVDGYWIARLYGYVRCTKLRGNR